MGTNNYDNFCCGHFKHLVKVPANYLAQQFPQIFLSKTEWAIVKKIDLGKFASVVNFSSIAGEILYYKQDETNTKLELCVGIETNQGNAMWVLEFCENKILQNAYRY